MFSPLVSMPKAFLCSEMSAPITTISIRFGHLEEVHSSILHLNRVLLPGANEDKISICLTVVSAQHLTSRTQVTIIVKVPIRNIKPSCKFYSNVRRTSVCVLHSLFDPPDLRAGKCAFAFAERNTCVKRSVGVPDRSIVGEMLPLSEGIS